MSKKKKSFTKLSSNLKKKKKKPSCYRSKHYPRQEFQNSPHAVGANLVIENSVAMDLE